AISGENVGFMVSCRNIGAQHPKEYQLSENLLNLKLFSPSTGKELDFRMPALMKNWGMSPKEKIEGHDKVSEHLLEKYLNFIVKHKSNAVGWSKTHDILLTPFLSTHNIQQTSFLHSKQVYIHNSPKWVRETEVIGPLHPKDTEKFPEEETVIDGIFWGLYKMWSCGPYGGFIDYHAGPNRIVHGYRSGGYSLRADSWYLYARSGERDLREFAQGSNRVFLDGNISHWNFTDKIMGLLIGSAVSPGKKSERNRVIDLPMHWQGGGLRYELSTVADMEQALLDYYFTGYRRAGDILVNFSNAAKNNLTYEEKHDRVILAMRHLTEAYEFTWEPRLRELIYEINNRYLYDPEGMVLLSKTRPYRSTTYKTETDQDSLLLMWSVFKDPLFKKMAISIGQNNWENMSILPRVRTQSQNRATGLLYYFMWKETKNPVFLSDFDYARRRLVADRLVDINTKKVIVPCTSQIPRFFKGLPLAMDMLSQSDAQIETPSSWLAFKVEESPIRIFFVKPGAETLRVDSSAEKNETELNILIRKEGNVSVNQTASKEKKDIPKPSQAGGNIVIKPHISYEGHMWSGHDLHTVIEKSTGVSKAIIPKDAPGGVYELSVNQSGYYSVFSDKHIPIALYAPEGWYPLKMNPPVRTYFNVPKGADKGRIFFEKKTNLFTPNGETYNDGKEVFGWVEIPKNLSGLWGFESVDPGKVKVENIPPFFAIENPKLYNIPLEKKAPPLQKVKGSLDWASKWRVFGPFHQYDPVVPLSVLSSYPEKIKVGEKEVKGVDIEVSDTIYDFPNILKEEQSGSVAYVFLTFNSNKTQNVTLGMGADWWMQVWVNGKLVHDSTKTSNIHFPFSIWNHLVNVRVKKGENLLAVRFVRGGGSQLALGGPDQLRVTPLPSDNNRFVGMSEAEKEFSVFLTGER
ncbi:hypothetical protein M0P98_08410, partial [bacterium]|nr:hypothetical protein [bacterium]